MLGIIYDYYRPSEVYCFSEMLAAFEGLLQK